jgi:DNA ligase (NAD+)
MNIDGFGKSNVETFYDKGWISDLSDIYNLDYDSISNLEGFGSRSVEKLKSAIDKAKSNPIHRLLNSLSIHHLGRKASKLIAQEINHVLELKNWKEEQYTDIKDIGPVVAQNVSAYFSDDKHIAVLEKMESYGVNLQQTELDKPKQVRADAPLIGKTILFTGSLQTMSRKVAQATAEEAGAKNISAVSSKLDILVVGEKAGSKLKKAQALGTVEIMTEEAFNQLVNS